MIWQDLTKDEKVAAVMDAWKPDFSAAHIAKAIEVQLKSSVTRNSIIGVYTRSDKLGKTHPLGGTKSVRGPRGVRLQQARSSRSEGLAALAGRPKPTKGYRTQRQKSKEAKIYIWTGNVASAPIPQYQRDTYAAYDASSKRVSLVDLGTYECRFSVNNPEPKGEHLSCGHAAKMNRDIVLIILNEPSFTGARK